MIRKHLTTIICLTILLLVNLYLLFEVLSSSHHQLSDHLFHQSAIGFLSAIFLIIYFKKHLLGKAKSGSFFQYKVLALVLLLVFTFIHLSPAKTSFAFHHQSESQDGTSHPCCMPQITVLNPSLEVEIISLEYKFFNQFSQKEIYSLAKNINNKSPPLS